MTRDAHEPWSESPDFRALFEAGPLRSLAVLPDAPRYTIVAVSEAYVNATMTSRAELLGRGLIEAVDQRWTGDELHESIERAIRGRASDPMPVRWHGEGGVDERCWRPVNSPVFGPDGQLAYIIHHLEDVTELVRLQQASAEQRRLAAAVEERLASFVEQAPDGIFVADLDGRYTDVNQAGCVMLGLSREQIIGKTILDLIPPEDAERLWRVKAQLLTGGILVDEWRLRRKDGGYLPVEVSARILGDGRWQGFVRDISERKRAEAALLRAIRSRDEVLGIVAHDLRNPLSRIIVNTELLRRTIKLGARSVEVIARAAKRMNRLIDDMLDVARLDAGSLAVHLTRIAAGLLLAEAIEVERARASSASLELHVQVGAGLPDVLADRDRILQVFDNLIGNAIKFTSAGGRIQVGASPRGLEVLFWVSDTGPGIAAEDLPRMFDRFWQATRTDHRSAGLGLSIVRGIVEAHGGQVCVDSRIGEGTTFFFTLPAAPTVTGREASRPDSSIGAEPRHQPALADQLDEPAGVVGHDPVDADID